MSTNKTAEKIRDFEVITLNNDNDNCWSQIIMIIVDVNKTVVRIQDLAIITGEEDDVFIIMGDSQDFALTVEDDEDVLVIEANMSWFCSTVEHNDDVFAIAKDVWFCHDCGKDDDVYKFARDVQDFTVMTDYFINSHYIKFIKTKTEYCFFLY